MQLIVPVILSGGSGTRLWPLSRKAKPKQFLRLVGDHSLFQESVLRARALAGPVGAPLVVCNEDHRFLVAEQLREIDATAHTIALEPGGRNTAPAVAVAALLAQRSVDESTRAVLGVFPADHVIASREAFVAAVADAVEAASQDFLVTFGVLPDRPETGYGYLLRGADRSRWSDLDEFVEKPDLPTAERYLASGRYLWNSGMFVFTADAYLAELARHEPKMLTAVEDAVAGAARDTDFLRLGPAFLDCPSKSIDYAVMERTRKAAVVPLDAGWNDVGSWSALHDVLVKDEGGNVLRGDVIAADCRNSYIAANARTVAALGVNDLIIVETEDAVLVIARDKAQDVKRIVDELAARSGD